MALSREEIHHIASLARMVLTDEEQVKFGAQISSIVEYVAKLQEVDTVHVEPTSQVTGLVNVLRPDELRADSGEIRARIIEAFPVKEGDLLKTKGVF